MATSTGKTVALIVFVIILIFFGLSFTPFVWAPFGVFTGISNMIRFPGGGMFVGTHLLRLLPMLFLFFLWIFVVLWVYRDAEDRRMNGLLWALLVLIGNVIGLLIYLIVRADNSQREVKAAETAAETVACPGCGKTVGADFAFCNFCGGRLENACPKCNQPAEANWKLCPHCGEKLSAGA